MLKNRQPERGGGTLSSLLERKTERAAGASCAINQLGEKRGDKDKEWDPRPGKSHPRKAGRKREVSFWMITALIQILWKRTERTENRERRNEGGNKNGMKGGAGKEKGCDQTYYFEVTSRPKGDREEIS